MNLHYQFNQQSLNVASSTSDKNYFASISTKVLIFFFLFSFMEMQGQAKIGNAVFMDINGNGFQDDGISSGINGLTIELWSSGTNAVVGGGDDVFVSQQVSVNDGGGNPGFFEFSNIPNGKYYLKFPSKWNKMFLTQRNDADGVDANSNANRFSGNSSVFTINGSDNYSIDAGYSNLLPMCASPCDGQFVVEHTISSGKLDYDIVNEALMIPQFDANLGDLLRVELETRLTLSMSYAFENFNTVARTVSLSYFDTTSISGPGIPSGGNYIYARDTVLDNYPLAPNDNVNGSGPDYISDSLLLGDFFKDTSFIDAGNLAAFTGNGTLTYFANGVANTISTSSGNFYRFVLTSGTVEVKVRYVYCKSICTTVCNGPCDGQFTDTHTVSSGNLDYDIVNEPLTLPQFDASLGTLKRVELETKLSLGMDYAFENLNTVSRTVSLSYYDTTSISGPGIMGGGNYIYARDTILDNYPLAPNDNVNGSGPDYISDSLLLGVLFQDTAFMDGANLAAFTGNGTVTYLANGVANTVSTSSGNFYRFVLTSGIVELTVRYIYCKPICASVGDFVWHDVNMDGIQDAGEVGVAGVPVSLFRQDGTLVGTTITDAFGYYLFDNVLPGNYYVQFGLPVDYVFTIQGAGTPSTDSDANPLTGRTNVFTVLAEDSIREIDAGLIFKSPSSASLGNYVWLDTNADGLQDAGEVGIANVVVTLLDVNGNILRSTFTNADGEYYFTYLPAGDYMVEVSPLMGYSFTTQDAGNDQKDSDVDLLTGRTITINLSSGEQDFTWDIGFVQSNSNTASIGDFVWNDLNKDGIQDANEPGIASVRVLLFDDTNNLIATTFTNIFGYYAFTNVSPGTYYIQFVGISGYTFTLQNTGTYDEKDSDANNVGRTGNYIVNAGDVITSIDAGMFLTTSPGTGQIGDYVWYDLNKNGIQDATEVGVPGVSVELIDANTNTVLAVKATNGEGYYLFTDLAAGDYLLHFFNLPNNTVFTTQGVSAADGTDSNPNPSTGITPVITLAAAEINLTIDAGIYPSFTSGGKGSIGDFVWIDLNHDGIQDASEPGVGNIFVLLRNFGGTVIDSTVTDARGYYIFNDLDADTYQLTFSRIPSGFTFTLAQQGSDTTKDSDVDGSGQTIDLIVLKEGESRLDIDAGLFNPSPLGSIGDFVWFDKNGNALQDMDEPGVPGISVSLYDEFNTLLQTTATNSQGFYLFTGLAAGNYKVQVFSLPTGLSFVTKGTGSNPTIDSDVEPSTGLTDIIPIAAGQNRTDIDAGVNSTRAALGDYVWNDTDKDGVQDATEVGVSGVTVTLYDNGGIPLASTVTDANGFYIFVNVLPGVPYELGFSTLPLGSKFTLQDAAGNDDIDSDVDVNTGLVSVAPLAAGEVNLSYDAGIVTKITTSLTGYVWYDKDRDGLQDATEKPVPAVTVTLYDAGGNAVAVTLTGPDGIYLFENLLPGTYEVRFTTLPLNSVFTIPNAGNDSIDSDVTDFITGSAGNTIVIEGIRNDGPDAGIIPTATLGGRAFSDDNSDGLQTLGEFGMINVLVTLYNEFNQVVGTQTTRDGGYYLFTNLIPDLRYYVSFDSVANRAWTYQNIGTNDSIDSDVYNYKTAPTPSLRGYTPLLAPLMAGEDRRFVDAGYLLPGIALPVVLIDLKAELVGNNGWISWSTTQEENSDYFQVMRSFDGIHFNDLIGNNIPAKGTSTSASFYGTVDKGIGAVNIEHVYYRLTMVDIDGSSTNSNVVELKVRQMDEIVYLNVYPSLVINDEFDIVYQLYGKRFATLTVFNELGQVMVQQDILTSTDVTDLKVDASTWAAGVYNIQINTEEGQVNRKIVIQ